MLIHLFALSGFWVSLLAEKSKQFDSDVVQTDEIIDFDGDGFFSDEDCDDNNSMISPSAMELCGLITTVMGVSMKT